jgi:hypothetical protein
MATAMNGTFELHRISELTGKDGVMTFPAAMYDDIALWLTAPWQFRPHVQDAFPQLDADHREFLMTGITPEEWAELMGPES